MRLLAVVPVVLGLAAMPGPALTAFGGKPEIMAQVEGMQPLGRVLRQIEQRYPGRALDAQLNERTEPPVYRIKWLGEDGKVRDVTVDARTGRILELR